LKRRLQIGLVVIILSCCATTLFAQQTKALKAIKVLYGKVVAVDAQKGDIVIQTSATKVKITDSGHSKPDAKPAGKAASTGLNFITAIENFERFEIDNWVVILHRGIELDSMTTLKEEPRVSTGEISRLYADAMSPSDVYFSLKEQPGISFHIPLRTAVKCGLTDVKETSSPFFSMYNLVKPQGKVKVVAYERNGENRVLAVEKVPSRTQK
jgi:hypothetical protein